MPSPAISVAIVTRNRCALLRECLASLAKQTLSPCEILVIDSDSEDETGRVSQEFPKTVHLKIPHIGNAYARNRAVAAARGDYVAFLDDDCEPATDWLENLCRGLSAHRADIAGGNAYFFDRPDKLQYALNRLSPWGDVLAPQDAAWARADVSKKYPLTFFCTLNLLAAREVLQKTGFDEYYKFWFEDTDFCVRAQQAGFKAVSVPEAKVFHKNASGPHRKETPRYIPRNTAYFVVKNFGLRPAYFLHLAVKFLKTVRSNYRPRLLKNNILFLADTFRGIRDGRRARKGQPPAARA